jgi:hypothetical protein
MKGLSNTSIPQPLHYLSFPGSLIAWQALKPTAGLLRGHSSDTGDFDSLIPFNPAYHLLNPQETKEAKAAQKDRR